MGVQYTQFSVNSNGVLRLGGTAISNTQYSFAAAGLSLIAPFGLDQYIDPTGKVHCKLLGTAPARRLVVE